MKRWIVFGLLTAAFAALLTVHHTVILRDWDEADRVEVLADDLDAAEVALREAGGERGWEISQEGDRLSVLHGDRFASWIARSALSADGSAVLLDYGWGSAVLRQSGGLWTAWAAVMALVLLWTLVWRHGSLELERAREALETMYLPDHLSSAGVRLLAKLIVAVIVLFVTLALIQWLWNVPVELPSGFLPEGSIFDLAHYRQWAAGAFPEGLVSDYGAALAQKLRLGHLLAAAECAVLTAWTIVVRAQICREPRTGRQ